MDGWVKIGTELDEKKLESDLKQLESDLKRLEKTEVNLKVKLDKTEAGLSEYYAEIEKLKQATEQELKLAVTDEQAKNVLAVEEHTLSLINSQYEKQLNTVSQIKSELEENKNKQQSVAQAIEQTNASLSEAKHIKNIYDQVGESTDNVKNKLSGVINNVVKWGLALFGVRSIYSGIRSLMSTLSNYNEQIKTDLEYVKFAIAIGFEGIIQSIIKGVFTILQYINYIAMAWFGVNLFAKASANNFNKVKGGISGANKEAKELQKTLTGFDEMNILNDSGGTSPGGGGGGMSPLDPSMDLSKMDVPIPAWLEWIAKNKDKILSFFKGLGIVIAGYKILKFISNLGLIQKGLKLVKGGIKGVIDKDALLKGVGIGLMIAGVVLLIDNIRKLILNWDEMTTKEKIITGVLATIGLAFVALGYSIATGISVATLGIGALIGAVVGLLAIVGSYIAKTIESEKEVANLEKAEERLKIAKDNLKKATDDLNNAILNEIDAIKRAEEAKKELEEAEKRLKFSGADLQKQVEDGTLKVKDMDKAQMEVYEKYIKNEQAQQKLKDATKETTDATKEQNKWKKEEVRQSELVRLQTIKEKEGLEAFRDETIKAAKSGKISWEDASKVIKKEMKSMSADAQDVFIKDIPNNIKKRTRT